MYHEADCEPAFAGKWATSRQIRKLQRAFEILQICSAKPLEWVEALLQSFSDPAGLELEPRKRRIQSIRTGESHRQLAPSNWVRMKAGEEHRQRTKYV